MPIASQILNKFATFKHFKNKKKMPRSYMGEKEKLIHPCRTLRKKSDKTEGEPFGESSYFSSQFMA